jgi:hypothetical protein
MGRRWYRWFLVTTVTETMLSEVFLAGATLVPIHLPGTLHELKTEIQRLHEAHLVPENL